MKKRHRRVIIGTTVSQEYDKRKASVKAIENRTRKQKDIKKRQQETIRTTRTRRQEKSIVLFGTTTKDDRVNRNNRKRIYQSQGRTHSVTALDLKSRSDETITKRTHKDKNETR